MSTIPGGKYVEEELILNLKNYQSGIYKNKKYTFGGNVYYKRL